MAWKIWRSHRTFYRDLNVQGTKGLKLTFETMTFKRGIFELFDEMSQRSRGFIYYASHNNVTGVREKLPEDLEFAVKRVKEITQKPVAVGFGISNPEQVKIVSRFADGVIVGSAIVKIIEENLRDADLIARIGNFISSLSDALKSWDEHNFYRDFYKSFIRNCSNTITGKEWTASGALLAHVNNKKAIRMKSLVLVSKGKIPFAS